MAIIGKFPDFDTVERQRVVDHIAERDTITAKKPPNPLGQAAFDVTKPYAVVHGHPTRKYQQPPTMAGAYYDSKGRPTA